MGRRTRTLRRRVLLLVTALAALVLSLHSVHLLLWGDAASDTAQSSHTEFGSVAVRAGCSDCLAAHVMSAAPSHIELCEAGLVLDRARDYALALASLGFAPQPNALLATLSLSILSGGVGYMLATSQRRALLQIYRI